MASTSGSEQGGKSESFGQKRKYSNENERKKAWHSQHKEIYLSANMFTTWNDTKIKARYKGKAFYSDNNFAAHLLSLELQ